MKAGEIITLASTAEHRSASIPSSLVVGRSGGNDRHVKSFVHFGTHTDEEYGKSDACKPVEDGRADVVLVVKVIAVVRRGARVEE